MARLRHAKPRNECRSRSRARITRTLASAAHQAQHHHEQVDEVEVERKRAHHGLAAGRSGVIAAVVHPLDPLGIVGPAKTPTPIMEITQSSPLDLRNRLTRLAIMMPIRPMNRKVPNPDKFRWVV